MNRDIRSLLLALSLIFFSGVLHADGPSAARLISKEGDHWIYEITARANSLSMIALDVYGDSAMSREIIAWNHLTPPFKLPIGKKLVLKKAPARTDEQANLLLTEMWQKLGNEERAARIESLVENELLSEEPQKAPKK